MLKGGKDQLPYCKRHTISLWFSPSRPSGKQRLRPGFCSNFFNVKSQGYQEKSQKISGDSLIFPSGGLWSLVFCCAGSWDYGLLWLLVHLRVRCSIDLHFWHRSHSCVSGYHVVASLMAQWLSFDGLGAMFPMSMACLTKKLAISMLPMALPAQVCGPNMTEYDRHVTGMGVFRKRERPPSHPTNERRYHTNIYLYNPICM